MQKRTRTVLWIAFVVIAICVPTIVARDIIETGNWWMMLYLAWGLGIELVIWKLGFRKGI